jgi:hypothetical protein
MLCVYKYAVPGYHQPFTLDLPKGAQILSVRLQHNLPQIWALVDLDKPVERRYFIVVETGEPLALPVSWVKFLGTLLLEGGHYVLHLFEIIGTAQPS